MIKKLIDNKGVSLVEILAAMAILAIVVVPLAKTFMDSFKFQARSQVKTEANKVIEFVAEQLKSKNYDSIGVEDELKNWVTSSGEEPCYVEIDNLGGSRLTAGYGVTIDKIDVSEIQMGGIGTPDLYDIELSIDEDDYNIIDYTGKLGIEYSDSLLEINSATDDKEYMMLIGNNTDSPLTIDVWKKVSEKLKIYTAGRDIKLKTYNDPSLSREEKLFSWVPLGNKEEIKDEKEYFYKVRISAVNLEDNTITASMENTFNMLLENN